MSRSRGKSTFTVPVLAETKYGVHELFEDHEIDDLIMLARRRIISAFRHATEVHHGRKKGTDNYIRGIEPKMSALAAYVLRWMKDPLIKPRQLPREVVQSFGKKELDRYLYQLQFDLLMAALQVMCVRPPKTPAGFSIEASSDEIHYDTVRCFWEIRQSSLDELRLARRARTLLKNDARNYHGRNRSQSRARGVPPGTSVGRAW